MSSVNLEEWKLYQQEFEEEKEARNDGAITPGDSLRKRQREQRRKSLAQLAQYGVPVLNIARHCLKIQQREERRFLRGTGKKVRRHKPRFEAWLRAKGLHRQAGLWRYRSAWGKDKTHPRRRCRTEEENPCGKWRISGVMPQPSERTGIE